MDLEKVKEILKPYVEENELKLYDVRFTKEYGYKVLQVFLDKKGGIDTDTLALANDYLSERLDSIDQDMGEYMLEVSSPGAEHPLRNEEEELEAIGEYIYVRNETDAYEGYLNSFENGILNIKINIKGRIKNIDVNYSDIKEIRLSVKI